MAGGGVWSGRAGVPWGAPSPKASRLCGLAQQVWGLVPRGRDWQYPSAIGDPAPVLTAGLGLVGLGTPRHRPQAGWMAWSQPRWPGHSGLRTGPGSYHTEARARPKAHQGSSTEN